MEYNGEASTSNNSNNFTKEWNQIINNKNKLEQEKRDWYQVGNYHRTKYIFCENKTGKYYHYDKCKQTINNLNKLDKKIVELEKLAAEQRRAVLTRITARFKNLEYPD